MTIREALERAEDLRFELRQLGEEHGYDTELDLAQDIPEASTLHTYYDKASTLVFRL